jgi:hypothetical protein
MNRQGLSSHLKMLFIVQFNICFGLYSSSSRRAGFTPGSGEVGFVVDKVELVQVFSEYFGFPCQSSFHQIPHPQNHPGQVK